MRLRFGALALSLWTSLAYAATGASYLDLNLHEDHYLSEVQNSAQDKSYTVYAADLNLETQSTGFDYKLNPVFEGNFQNRDETYIGLPEAFVQPRKLAPGFSLTIGRQKRMWSRLDQEFNLGVWQPQLRWDYLTPQQEGLTGVFFDWSLSSTVRFTFFTSPLFIPDQGPQYRLVDGQFSSSNRWFSQPQGRVQLFSHTAFASDAPLYFELESPSEQDIFMHSSFGFSMSYQSNDIFWSQLSYAYKPRNQIHLGIECANCAHLKDPPHPLEITAIIHPKVVNHNVLTWEAGFDRIDDRGWISLTGDFPQKSGFPAAYAEAPLNTMIISGFAYQHYVRPFVGVPSWLQFSYMRIFEFKHKPDNGLVPDDEVQSSLDRYPYSEIAALDWRFLLNQTQNNRLHWHNRYTYSVPERGGWLSESLEWAMGPLAWTVGFDILGAEVDPNSEQAGLFSRYRANDRVYAGMSYVF